jgi:hypothetical protein
VISLKRQFYILIYCLCGMENANESQPPPPPPPPPLQPDHDVALSSSVPTDIVTALLKTFFHTSLGMEITSTWEVCSGRAFRTHGPLELLSNNCFGLSPTKFRDSGIAEGSGSTVGDNDEFAHVTVIPTRERRERYVVTLYRGRYDAELDGVKYTESICRTIHVRM